MERELRKRREPRRFTRELVFNCRVDWVCVCMYVGLVIHALMRRFTDSFGNDLERVHEQVIYIVIDTGLDFVVP